MPFGRICSYQYTLKMMNNIIWNSGSFDLSRTVSFVIIQYISLICKFGYLRMGLKIFVWNSLNYNIRVLNDFLRTSLVKIKSDMHGHEHIFPRILCHYKLLLAPIKIYFFREFFAILREHLTYFVDTSDMFLQKSAPK